MTRPGLEVGDTLRDALSLRERHDTLASAEAAAGAKLAALEQRAEDHEISSSSLADVVFELASLRALVEVLWNASGIQVADLGDEVRGYMLRMAVDAGDVAEVERLTGADLLAMAVPPAQPEP